MTNETISITNQLDNQSIGSDSNYLCYEWKHLFSGTRDVLLQLRVQLVANVSLLIFKYEYGDYAELAGELKGCTVGLKGSLDVGLANCTGFALTFVAKTCLPTQSKAVLSFYSTPSGSDPSSGEKAFCGVFLANSVAFLVKQSLVSPRLAPQNCPVWNCKFQISWVIVVTVRIGLEYLVFQAREHPMYSTCTTALTYFVLRYRAAVFQKWRSL